MIVHDARPACFVLIHWWANSTELHQRYYTAPLERPGELALMTTPSIGCVWELAVIAHERQAFVRHILANRPPDIPGYLVDCLHADL